MKEQYSDLMERALSAYTDEHIARYFEDVKRDGLTEHGFPRLTANMGILLAHGRRSDLRTIFLEMMEYCCRTIPTVKAANDFPFAKSFAACARSSAAARRMPRPLTDGSAIFPPSIRRPAITHLPFCPRTR